MSEETGKPAGEQPPAADRYAGTRDASSGRFLPGNPGKPMGGKYRLVNRFFKDLVADWEEHGALVIAKVRAKDPTAYLRVVASQMPATLDVESGGEGSEVASITVNFVKAGGGGQ